MRTGDFSWLIAGVLLNALAQLCLKVATQSTGVIEGSWRALGLAAQTLSTNLAFWLAVMSYALSVLVWVVGLSRVPVSQAYPVLSIGYIVAALLAWALLGESINLERWTGIGLIIAGVILVSSTS